MNLQLIVACLIYIFLFIQKLFKNSNFYRKKSYFVNLLQKMQEINKFSFNFVIYVTLDNYINIKFFKT